jgi:hypothetical protein
VSASIDSISVFATMNAKILDQYHENFRQARSDDEAFMYGLKIAEFCISNNTHEALKYQQRCHDLAVKMGGHDKMAAALLMKCRICNAAGYLAQCRATLNTLKDMPLSSDDRLEYYDCELTYWQNYSIFYNRPQPSRESVSYSDSILSSGIRLSPTMLLHARFWHETRTDRKRQLLMQMKAQAEKMSPNERDYELMCAETAILANDLGDRPTLLRMSANSVVAALRAGSSQLTMLWYVTNEAISVGELDYADKFMNLISQSNKKFPDRLRIPLYDLQENLHKALQQRERHYAQQSLALALASLLLFFIAAAGIVTAGIMARKRKAIYGELERQYALVKKVSTQLRQEQKNLVEANRALTQQDEQLKQNERNLREANYLKEEYIGQMFAMCAEYLHQIEDIKKDLNRKLMAGQYDMAIEATRGNSDANQKALHDLWDRFDEIFLRLFPDFTEQFNSLLRPEEQIRLRNPKRLNTDLRIYALVRLGINNSVHISQILGLSPQTVYNARQKMRTRATPSTTDFAERVRGLAVGDTQENKSNLAS